MGTKRKLFGIKKHNTAKATQAALRRRITEQTETATIKRSLHTSTGPKRLSTLCKNVIKKYKLIESQKKFGEPESSTIIGGKPLRDRKKIATERASSVASTSSQPPKKRKVNKAKKIDKPSKRLPKINVDIKTKGKRRKEAFPEILVSTANVNQIRIKEEPDPIDDNQDPFAPDDDYTVIVKEELEVDVDTKLVPQSTSTSETPQIKIVMPTLVPGRNVASSSSSLPSATSGPPLMTVVADEMQIFANNLAEQLRTFPMDRALLLQLEIQTMIDNERQLLLH